MNRIDLNQSDTSRMGRADRVLHTDHVAVPVAFFGAVHALACTACRAVVVEGGIGFDARLVLVRVVGGRSEEDVASSAKAVHVVKQVVHVWSAVVTRS